MMKIPKLTVLAAAGILVLGAAGCAENSRTVGQTVDDADVTARVKTRLIEDDSTKARQIDVETSRGVVQLNGFVDTSAAKAQAEKLASGTDGVRSVRNNLVVRADDRSTGTVVDDAGLSAKVNTALAANTRTSALRINVAARDGDVQLSGYAKTADEKAAAAEVARSVDGVRSVRNEIDVR